MASITLVVISVISFFIIQHLLQPVIPSLPRAFLALAATGVCSITGIVTGLIAILKLKDRAILAFVAVVLVVAISLLVIAVTVYRLLLMSITF